MGYTQKVKASGKRSHHTEYVRVRIEVLPPEAAPYLPEPYTNLKNLTKKVLTDHEAAGWTTKFLGCIAKAREELANANTPLNKTMRAYPNLRKLEEVSDLAAEFGGTTDMFDTRPEPRAGAAKPAPIVPFATMIPKWATLKGKGKKAVQDMTTKCAAFTAWLEHDNMAEVTFEDGREWRDEMIQDGDLSTQSVSNYLKAVKALFSHAFEEGHIKDADGKVRTDDPMARIKYDPGDGKKRADFTMPERRSTLLKARDASPEIKWLTWLSAFQLTRTSEVADIHTRDFFIEDGVWAMQIAIKNRSKDQGIKTEQSHRKMALHSAVLDEGFIDFLQAAGDGPLFSTLALDSNGKRAGQASNLTSTWLRDVVGIKDPDKPFYSLRHSGITDLRIARTPNGEIAVKPDIERYLTAHGKRDEHGRYGEYPVSELKAAIEWVRNPIK
jgi:integrase